VQAPTPRGRVNKVGTGPAHHHRQHHHAPRRIHRHDRAVLGYAFVIFDDPNNAVSGDDTIYLADDTTGGTEGGLQKWTSTDGVNWAKQYRALSGTAAFRGVTGQYVGATLSLFATTTDNKLVSVTDTGSGLQPLRHSRLPRRTRLSAAWPSRPATWRGTPTPTPSPTPTPTPSLSINDVSQDEGNAGTTNFNFTVSLSSPAQTGGVSFTVNTANGTTNPATAGSDYVAIVGGSGSIPEGSSSTQVTVQVNGDMTTEPNETFFVNISGVTGAGVTDGQGLGTIQNDDITITPIHDIQGNGNASPSRRPERDHDRHRHGPKDQRLLHTRPGRGRRPEHLRRHVRLHKLRAVGRHHRRRLGARHGHVAEFISATSDEPVTPSDPKTATEITSPTTTILSSGNPLPAPLTEAILNPASPSRSAELEKYEYMRVSISSLTVTQPTNNNFGEFWGVVTSTPRPYPRARHRGGRPDTRGRRRPVRGLRSRRTSPSSTATSSAYSSTATRPPTRRTRAARRSS
jgi:hypothetical protein